MTGYLADKIPVVHWAELVDGKVQMSVKDVIPLALQDDIDEVGQRAVGPITEITDKDRFTAIHAVRKHLVRIRDSGNLRRAPAVGGKLRWDFDKESQVIAVDFRSKKRAP